MTPPLLALVHDEAAAPAGRSPDTGDEHSATLLVDLVREHGRRLHGYASRFVGPGAPAEDVVQEAYAKAWRARRTVRTGDIHAGWLYRIVQTTALDELRRRRRDVAVPVDEQPERGVPDHGESVALRADIRAALARLPAPVRVVVELVDVQGMSYDEAAAALGVPRTTVASRLHRGHLALRRVLAPLHPGVA